MLVTQFKMKNYMRVVSTIKDGRINALNVLTEMSIGDYLSVGEKILQKNEFQRNRVKRSSSVYSLLRKDLKENCTFPPIVLALSFDKVQSLGLGESLTDEKLLEIFKPEYLVILDGLQRTYNLKEVKDEFLKNGDTEKLEKYLNNKIRIEIYIGINKLGILYRMLTLNTGQTPMSTRHQIEILYSDYIENDINGIKLIKQVDETRNQNIGEYQFKDVVEGFNSYLDRDESGINRNEILENIENLEKLSAENNEKDIFEDYITSFNEFMKKMHVISNDWKYNKESIEGNIDSIFGKDILHIFNKPQVLSAFGAAIGKLKDNELISSFDDIKRDIRNIAFSDKDINEHMNSLLTTLDKVKKNASKIGVEQRRYLYYFYFFLFNPNSESYLSFDKTITVSYKRYSSLL